jgi:Ca2+-binding RTX toxin-like protein
MAKKTHLGPKDNTYISKTPHEEIWGDGGDDTITVNDGGGTIHGGLGNDHLNGGDSDDYFSGDEGNDVLHGADGKDYLYGWLGKDILDGGKGDDLLIDYSGDDVLRGGKGNDELDGGPDNDVLYGGDGNDVLWGGDDAFDKVTHNIFTGGKGNDQIYSDSPLDEVYAGAGDDLVSLEVWPTAGHGKTEVTGGSGSDILYVDSSYEVKLSLSKTFAIAVNGKERIVCSSFERIHFEGGDGTSEIVGGAFNDRFKIGTAFHGHETASTLDGAGGDDVFSIYGVADDFSADQIDGGSGQDTLMWSRLRDGDGLNSVNVDVKTGVMTGDSTSLVEFSDIEVFNIITDDIGTVTFKGGNGNESLYVDAATSSDVDTGKGDDSVTIGSGDANVKLGAGDDLLVSGSGSDVITSGLGIDIVTGGLGADVFVFSGASETGIVAATLDNITDFSQSEGDKIDLSRIDATGDAGDGTFTFIGSKAFMHHAGDLRFERFNNNGTEDDYTWVSGDIDGDGAADFIIRAKGLIKFVEGDFEL